MEQKNELLLFIEVASSILLFWICLFNHDANIFNKLLDKNCYPCEKLDTRNCRLLTKYSRDKISDVADFKANILHNREYEKKNMYNNEKGVKGKIQEYNRNSLSKAQFYTEVIDFNNGMFDGKHFHFEKKWIKKKDYEHFLEKKRRMCAVALKKIKFKNYGYIVAMFIIFYLFAIGIPLLGKLDFFKNGWENLSEENIWRILCGFVKEWGKTANAYVFLTLFCILIVISIILLVTGICKILRNNEKYSKIKLITE
ncbi:fam-m protein [Plasmodium malariae]|uniref:Fam-m protein n=1 Tax=Plasmodium malariae TaxID=5858 RepID=A0A1D3JHC5_PLAMA|nr:fam-m protein [Plasmodium malariae]SBT85716.1 fam-m protein [Plasmodium malariae]